MSKLSRTQALVLAAASLWPLSYVAWADGFSQAHLELPNGLQSVKMPTVKVLLERGLLLQEGDSHLEVTPAGHEALATKPREVAEVSTPGWRLTSTNEHRAGFTLGGTKFVVTTSGWPNSTIADEIGQHIAHSLNALHTRNPDKFNRELAVFKTINKGAFSAILIEAFELVHLLYPEIDGYPNNVTLGLSKRR